MMKKLLLILTISLLCASVAYAAPKIEIEGGLKIDFGKVKPSDSPLKTKIIIHNKGNQILIIDKVVPGCGCTTSKLANKEIMPGSQTTIDIDLDVSKYSGKINKPVKIVSNDPENDEVIVKLEADVFRAIKLFPSTTMRFGTMKQGGEGSVYKIVMGNKADVDIKITELKITGHDLKINIKQGDVIEKGSDIVLKATAVPEQLGNYRTRIRIKTDNPDMPELEIPGWGNVVPND